MSVWLRLYQHQYWHQYLHGVSPSFGLSSSKAGAFSLASLLASPTHNPTATTDSGSTSTSEKVDNDPIFGSSKKAPVFGSGSGSASTVTSPIFGSVANNQVGFGSLAATAGVSTGFGVLGSTKKDIHPSMIKPLFGQRSSKPDVESKDDGDKSDDVVSASASTAVASTLSPSKTLEIKSKDPKNDDDVGDDNDNGTSLPSSEGRSIVKASRTSASAKPVKKDGDKATANPFANVNFASTAAVSGGSSFGFGFGNKSTLFTEQAQEKAKEKANVSTEGSQPKEEEQHQPQQSTSTIQADLSHENEESP